MPSNGPLQRRETSPAPTIERPRIVFLHIPKAGGTSLRKVIFNAFEKKDIFWNNETGKINQVPFEDLSKFSIIAGHFQANNAKVKKLERYWGRQNLIYISIVRNPIDQLRSHFNYISQRPAHPLFTGTSIDEALSNKTRFAKTQKNIQSRYLHGAVNDERARYLPSFMRALIRSRNAEFKNAKAWAQHRRVLIGSTEAMPAFFEAFAQLIGTKIDEVPWVNTGRAGYHNTLQSPIVEDFIQANCQQDRLLFEWVQKNGGLINTTSIV